MSTNSSYYGYFLHLVKQNGIEKQIKKKIKKRLRGNLKIMISTKNDEVYPHFGRAPQYTLLSISNGEVIDKKVFSNPGHTIGSVPRFVKDHGAEVMITGGMGNRALQFFRQYEIEVIVGITGTVDDVVETLIKGKIKSGPSICKPKSGFGSGVEKIHTEADEHSHHHQ